MTTSSLCCLIWHTSHIQHHSHLKKHTINCNTHLKQSHNTALLTRDDWFLNRDVIDPYPGCKWKPPRHRSWQPAPVLLGRWEGTCGKMKAICLDGAMSSVCCVWCKQLNFSRYDEPWTVITHTNTHRDPQRPRSKTQQSLTDLCSVKSFWRNNCMHLFCTDRSWVTKVPKVGGVWLHKLQWQSNMLDLKCMLS